jgi:hypothetical protein
MLLVVFGAGASFDSSADFPFRNHADDLHFEVNRPPLAKDLFALRSFFGQTLERYREIKPIVHRLRPTGGRALEEELQILKSEADKYPTRHRQLAAMRFYLREIIMECDQKWQGWTRGVTNYASLFDQLLHAIARGAERPIVLATFNYDTLIENALATTKNLAFENLPSYTADQDFELFKLHGSVNWLRGTNYGLARDIRTVPHFLIENAATVLANDHFRITLDSDYQVGSTLMALPAIAVPLEQVKPFECPALHLERLKDLLPRVTEIVSIGWRGKEKHFLEMMKGCCKKRASMQWLIVAGSKEGATAIAGSLKDYGLTMRFKVFEGGFTELVRSNRIQTFLNV